MYKPQTYMDDNTKPGFVISVLQVQADVRTIISRDFATRHSLRFPRVERIRYDKSPLDVQTDQELWDLVNQNKGTVTGERTTLPCTSKLCIMPFLRTPTGMLPTPPPAQTPCTHDCAISTAARKGRVVGNNAGDNEKGVTETIVATGSAGGQSPLFDICLGSCPA